MSEFLGGKIMFIIIWTNIITLYLLFSLICQFFVCLLLLLLVFFLHFVLFVYIFFMITLLWIHTRKIKKKADAADKQFDILHLLLFSFVLFIYYSLLFSLLLYFVIIIYELQQKFVTIKRLVVLWQQQKITRDRYKTTF